MTVHRDGKQGSVLTPQRLEEAQKLLDAGFSRLSVAEELDLKKDTLSKAIQSGRLIEKKAEMAETAGAKGTTRSDRSLEDAKASEGMGVACTREGERILAALGKVNGCESRFEESLDVNLGGVLCLLPALLENGLLCGIKEFLGNFKGFYTQIHILLLLSYMALCRIKTVEQSRKFSPGEMGLLLGLDRIPEVRCLRKRMDTIAKDDGAEKWSQHLSEYWMAENPDTCGYLYVDGHVKVYHGDKTKLPARYVSRQRLCLRGISNYWVNDASGSPFFFIEKQVDHGLIHVLKNEIIPRLLKEVPHQPTQEQLDADGYLHRFVIVFDREGYSPTLFKELWDEHRIACLTYQKNVKEKWPESEFEEKQISLTHGEKKTMMLAERGTFIGNDKSGFFVKEIRRLTPTGHQTSIVSTAFRIDSVTLAPKMFSRWCQENFFRYMMQSFAIDIVAEYGTEELDATETVVNPTMRQLRRQINSLNGKMTRINTRFAEMTLNAVDPNDTKAHELWEKKKSELLEEMRQMQEELNTLKKKRKETPSHLSVSDLPEEHRFKALTTSRKHLLDAIRMIAYRAETSMANQLLGDSTNLAQARSIIQELCKCTVDLKPNYKEKTLSVHLHSASTNATNMKWQSLCHLLNQTETICPGTQLQMKFYSILDIQPTHQIQNGLNESSAR